MKPRKLRMKNIGPYLDETINFSLLDNMFLIKGDTGSGKTFIFDAITYALYGKLCGNRKDHESNFKSRYADEEDESFVEFEFSANGKKYFVTRTVPFEYTNRNGKISKKTKEVYFALLDSDENETDKNKISENLKTKSDKTLENKIEFSGKPTEIDEKIQEIIGLNADEFSQIILLPQGKFSEFLHKNSKERAQTLKTLFPVDFYTKVTEKVKEKFDKADEELKILEAQIKSSKSENDFSNAEEILKTQEDEIKNITTLEKENQKKLEEIAANKAKFEILFKDSQEFEENKNLLEELKSQEKEFSDLEIKIKNAENAIHLKEFIKSFETCSEQKSESEKNLQNAKNEKILAQKIFDELNLQNQEMKNLEQKNKIDNGKIEVLNKKIDDAKELPSLIEKEKKLATNIEENKNQLESLKTSLEKEKQKLKSFDNQNLEDEKSEKSAFEISKNLNDELKKLLENQNLLKNENLECKKRDKILQEKSASKNELSENQKKLNEENQKLERTKSTITEFEKKQQEQNLKNQAFAVSRFLVAGEPCPVCGSKNHPFPVEKPEGLLDFAEQIKTHKANLESIQTSISFFSTKVSALNQKIKTFDEELFEIKTQKNACELEEELKNLSEKISKIESELEDVQKLEEKISELEKAFEALKESSLKLQNEFSQVKAIRQTLEKSLGEVLENVIKKRDALQNELFKNQEKFETWQNDFTKSQMNLEKAKTKFEESQKNSLDANEKFLSSQKTLLEKIESSDFETLEDAKSALMSSQEIETSRKNLSDYKLNLKSISDAVKNAKAKNLKSSKEIFAELEELKLEEIKTNQNQNEVKNFLEIKKSENTKFKSDFEKLKKMQSEQKLLEEKIAPLAKLNSDLLGKNPQNLKFETWALGMYFEQVVSFASKRFFDISGGRFSFELKSEKSSGNNLSGLELKVFDSHSGKFSDPAELSGGETFEASISLALALTDVVQNSSGGIQLDSLFIDEGFGTLDPETLEKAMSVLTELGETKMIGMISHVSEMEDFPDIKSAIKVNKTNRGSTVTLEI